MHPLLQGAPKVLPSGQQPEISAGRVDVVVPQPRNGAALLAAATKRLVSSGVGVRLSKAVAMVTAVKSSSHASSIAECEYDSLRNIAHELVTAAGILGVRHDTSTPYTRRRTAWRSEPSAWY